MTELTVKVQLRVFQTEQGWIWEATARDNRFLNERAVLMDAVQSYDTEEDARVAGAFAITADPVCPLTYTAALPRDCQLCAWSMAGQVRVAHATPGCA